MQASFEPVKKSADRFFQPEKSVRSDVFHSAEYERADGENVSFCNISQRTEKRSFSEPVEAADRAVDGTVTAVFFIFAIFIFLALGARRAAQIVVYVFEMTETLISLHFSAAVSK